MNEPKAVANTRRTRILLVDDHAMLREGLAGFLSRQPDLEVCGEAGGAPEAMQQVLEKKPDFVIVDISLKNGHGIELIKQIHVQDDSIKMLVLSMHDESLFAERAYPRRSHGVSEQRAISDANPGCNSYHTEWQGLSQ